MATLTVKKPTPGDLLIPDLGIIIPGNGQDTFIEANSILQVCGSQNIRSFVATSTLVINDGVGDLSVADGLAYLTALWTQAGFSELPSLDTYQIQLGGQLDAVALPLAGCGIEIARSPRRLVEMRGRRGTVGSSGTTTVQLEINGSPVGGATLSWTSADAAFSLKTVALSILVAVGDRLSIRLTSAEVGGEDVFVEVN